MSNTPNTSIQPPQDNDSLLRRLVVLVENLTETVDEIKTDVKSLDQRISVLETSRDTVGKLDNLVATVAEFGQELKDVKAEIQSVKAEFRQEIQSAKAEFKQELESVKAEFHQEIQSVKNTLIEDRKEIREYLRKIERNTHKTNLELAETILRVDELEDAFSKKV